jgi:hypothetical protein
MNGLGGVDTGEVAELRRYVAGQCFCGRVTNRMSPERGMVIIVVTVFCLICLVLGLTLYGLSVG